MMRVVNPASYLVQRFPSGRQSRADAIESPFAATAHREIGSGLQTSLSAWASASGYRLGSSLKTRITT